MTNKPKFTSYSFKKLKPNPAHLAGAWSLFGQKLKWSAVLKMVRNQPFFNSHMNRLLRRWRYRVHKMAGCPSFQAIWATLKYANLKNAVAKEGETTGEVRRRRYRAWSNCWPKLFQLYGEEGASESRKNLCCGQERLCPWCYAMHTATKYCKIERLIRDYDTCHPSDKPLKKRFRLSLVSFEFTYRPRPVDQMQESDWGEACLIASGVGEYKRKNPLYLFNDEYGGKNASILYNSPAFALLPTEDKNRLHNRHRNENRKGWMTQIHRSLQGKTFGMFRYVTRYPYGERFEVPGEDGSTIRGWYSYGVTMRVSLVLVSHVGKPVRLPQFINLEALQKEVASTGWELAKISEEGFDPASRARLDYPKNEILASKSNLANIVGQALSMPEAIWYAHIEDLEVAERASRNRRSFQGRLAFDPRQAKKLREEAARLRAVNEGTGQQRREGEAEAASEEPSNSCPQASEPRTEDAVLSRARLLQNFPVRRTREQDLPQLRQEQAT